MRGIALAAVALALAGAVTVKNSRFLDEQGRTLLFHGVNMVYKVPPYIPSNGSFDA